MAWATTAEEGRYLRLRFTNGRLSCDYTINPQGNHVWLRGSLPFYLAPSEWREGFVHNLTRRVAAAVFRQRGTACLHASTVFLGGKAIAITGESGLGKSTTTAAFVARGHSLLADDIAALTESTTGFYVQPGLPRLPLGPSVIEAVFGMTVPTPHPFMADKHHLTLAANGTLGAWRFHSEASPLAAVYELTPLLPQNNRTSVEPLRGIDKQKTLEAHSYLSYVLDEAGKQRDCAALGRLATAVPIRRVHRPAGLEHLQQTVDAIVADAMLLPA